MTRQELASLKRNLSGEAGLYAAIVLQAVIDAQFARGHVRRGAREYLSSELCQHHLDAVATLSKTAHSAGAWDKAW